jgi:hypothetical protein
MKTIKFSDAELEMLRLFYKQELEAAVGYVAEVRQIIEKLGKIRPTMPPVSESTESLKKRNVKRGRKRRS